MHSESHTDDDFRWQLVRWLIINVVVVPLGLLFWFVGPGDLIWVAWHIVGEVLTWAIVGASFGVVVGLVHQRWIGRSILIWTIIGFVPALFGINVFFPLVSMVSR